MTFLLRPKDGAVLVETAGTSPVDGLALHEPTVEQVTVPAGLYEYRMACVFTDSKVWWTPWIEVEFEG